MRPVNAPSSTQNATRQSVEHYENFPVASWLCPPRLRPPIAAIYHFARTADDLADEGDVTFAQRLDDLAAYRADLAAIVAGRAPSTRWPQVFGPLAREMTAFSLPHQLLADLLDAFTQDVHKTQNRQGYADRTELLAYCQRSAAPIGRLLLHLYGVADGRSLQQSDAICNALQLINFWQDLSLDLPRGRYYLPADARLRHGVSDATLLAREQTPEATRLIAEQVAWARELMQSGTPLVHAVPGRAGWELRLVVQGGLRILDKIEAMHFATLRARPRIGAWDAPLMLARAFAM
ncbi:squalene synthase HpnC [Rhodoferax koreense]|uniref:Squalene synthase HpnC n=1 Tax=Rhodoferax koreensis TaxID=1842727 RepID=A0A1P8JUL8_9BURK|nr:squalene synthase HpnC [Rhodoferax koreense]APW37470.1 squalene synthase HpnC [Rhodoferax koreense]